VSGPGSAFALAAHQEQQDAHEFLQFIVDQAHEDVRRLRTLAGLADPKVGQGLGVKEADVQALGGRAN